MKPWLQSVLIIASLSAIFYGDKLEDSLLIFIGGVVAVGALIWLISDLEEYNKTKQ